MTEPVSPFKRPESVVIVVHAPTGRVLLLRRADRPDFWQSVTGSMRWDESDPRVTAARELQEETGLRVAPEVLHDLGLTQRFPIVPPWRQRYAPEVTENIEHAYALEMLQETVPRLAPREHIEYGWFPFDEAQQKVASWSNRKAIQAVASLSKG